MGHGMATARACALAVCLTAALVAACGGPAGGPSPAPTAALPSGGLSPAPAGSPTGPSSAPLEGTVRQAAAEYWRLVDSDDYAAAAAAGVSGSRPQVPPYAPDDIARVRLVRVSSLREHPKGVVHVRVEVYIRPTGKVTPWGEAARHTLFMTFEAAPSGGWLVREWGTGP